MRIGLCSRTNDVIEPRLMPQWWVNCKGMAEKSIEKAKTGELKFTPESSRYIFFSPFTNNFILKGNLVSLVGEHS